MMSKYKRREFLKRTAAAYTFGATSHLLASATPPAPDTSPDILLIMPDQMRGDCLSFLGHTGVSTPNIDKLAQNGVLFRRAYTPVASCIPARYALLTGLSPQKSGIVGFKARKISTKTLPGLLSEKGYSTTLVGRCMHQVPASGMCGYQKQILGSTYESNDDYDKFLKNKAPQTGGIKNFVKKIGLHYNTWPAAPWPLANELHPTEWITRQSRKVIEESDIKKPLFITASYYAPHPPLFPTKEIFKRNMAKTMPKPAHGDWVDWSRLLVNKGAKRSTRVLLKGETLKKAQAGYFGLIEHIDDQIAELINDFKTRSEKAGRPWVIVFTSDHGEMLGDNGYFRKCEPYEGSANIPFIFCASPSMGLQKNIIKQPVALQDIMPTLLSLANVPCPPYVDGADLSAALRGSKRNVREWLHFEHAPCYAESQAFHALTDGRYKYIWRPLNGKEQLFDLQEDPREEHDLAKDSKAEHILKKWRNILAERLADRPEGFSKDGKLVPGRKYPKINNGNIPI